MLYRNKKKIDPNKGKWITVGGHIEHGETKEEACVREGFEETGYKLLNYKYRFSKLIGVGFSFKL